MKPHLQLVTGRYPDGEDARNDEEDGLTRHEQSGYQSPKPRIEDFRKRRAHGMPVWPRPKSSSFDVSTTLIARALSTAETETQLLLQLADNWDDEGAVRISEKTRAYVIEIFRSVLASISYDLLPQVLEPKITPLSSGSVDLYWKTPTFTLLINIPANDGEHAEFYGSNLGTGYDLRGRIRMDDPNLRFLNWLVE
jgi:hypothetical protein